MKIATAGLVGLLAFPALADEPTCTFTNDQTLLVQAEPYVEQAKEHSRLAMFHGLAAVRAETDGNDAELAKAMDEAEHHNQLSKAAAAQAYQILCVD